MGAEPRAGTPRRHRLTAGVWSAVAGVNLLTIVLNVRAVERVGDVDLLVVAGLQAIVFSIALYLVPYYLVRAAQVGPGGFEPPATRL